MGFKGRQTVSRVALCVIFLKFCMSFGVLRFQVYGSKSKCNYYCIPGWLKPNRHRAKLNRQALLMRGRLIINNAVVQWSVSKASNDFILTIKLELKMKKNLAKLILLLRKTDMKNPVKSIKFDIEHLYMVNTYAEID